MYAIMARVKGIESREGCYKNIVVAEKHKRRLEKKYTSTAFKISQLNKKDK